MRSPNTEPLKTLRYANTALARLFPPRRPIAAAILYALDDWMSSLLGESFADRLSRVPLTLGDSGVDAFGLDPEWAKNALFCVALLHRKYFRTEVHGARNVPPGRLLLVANHSGQIPIDAALVGATMFMDADPPRFIRTMVEKWSQTLPFVSLFFSRVGQVVGVPENAMRLLEREEALLVFPEGVRGIAKTFDHRYELQPFGFGFMRLALEARAPVIPCAIIGGEEQYVSVANLNRLAHLLRIPSLPVIPQLFVPGGQLPLPTKYRIYFGDAMYFSGDPDDDDAIIERKVDVVRSAIQLLLRQGLSERKHIFW